MDGLVMTDGQRHEFQFSPDGHALQMERDRQLAPLEDNRVELQRKWDGARAALLERHRQEVAALEADFRAKDTAAAQRIEAERQRLLTAHEVIWAADWEERRVRQSREYRAHLKEATRLRMKPEDYFDRLRDQKKRGV